MGELCPTLVPSEFGAKMVDSGEAKIRMATRDAFIRTYMAGALLALSAAFAVSVAVHPGSALASAILFPVMFCMI